MIGPDRDPMRRRPCDGAVTWSAEMSEQELTFLNVFGGVSVPLDAIDLGHLSRALGARSVEKGGSHIGLKLDAELHKMPALIASLRGLLSGLRMTPEFVRAIEAEPHVRRSGRGWMLRRQPLGAIAKSGPAVQGGRLIWQSNSVWPMAYATWFGQLVNVLYLYKVVYEDKLRESGENLERHGYARENVSLFAEYPRNLPTSQHYAVAALGAWLGGAINVQYFLYHATIKQVRDASVNAKHLEQMGMAADAKAMDGSGLIGVPDGLYKSLIHAQGDETVFGSLPLDEVNPASPPGRAGAMLDGLVGEPKNFSGVLVDKYYRMSFRAQNLDARGVYGASDVQRDHYEDFYKSLTPVGKVRCKHYCAPVINVSSTRELVEILNRIPRHGEGGVVLRGQRKLHLVRRDPAIQPFLFAGSCSTEPSLITSAARERTYVYEETHFALRRFLEQRIYAGDRASIATRIERWRAEAVSPSCKLDYAVMALAQHYGVPTHGLDVSLRPDVAIWFATNVFSPDKTTGCFRYDPLQPADWPANQEDAPVVIACQAVTNTVAPSLIECQELEEFGFSAKRPLAQSARFFHGGHSEHQNRLAETVVCVFRLHSANYELDVSFKSLFPPPEEDPAYELMLDFAETDGHRWAKYVTRFHPRR